MFLKGVTGLNAEIRSLFAEYTDNRDFSGAALIKWGAETVFEYAAGFAHLGFQIPNTIATKFDTASITKLFTAAGIVLLESRGMLDIDSRIHDILDLSDTEIPEDVTLRHLLTHTSGIADDAEEENGESYFALFETIPNYSFRENRDFLKNFAYKKPNFKAGTQARYNNCAFILLGLVIEKLTKSSYRTFIEENIFKLFGLHNTRFFAKDDASADIAAGYWYCSEEHMWKKNIYSFPPVGTADAGAYTTVEDLDKFLRLVKDSPVFGIMMAPQTECRRTSGDRTIRYGYGFELVEQDGRIIGAYKEGCNPGVCNIISYYPVQDITFTILGNRDSNVWKLHRKAQDILLGQ